MRALTVLTKVEIFYGLPKEHLEALAEICEEVTYQEGDIIVQEYMPSNELFVIVRGVVQIVMDPRALEMGGEASVIATLRSGQTFGEIGLVDRGLRTASARAASKQVDLLAIKRDALVQLCEADTQLGYQLMRNIAADLAFKIRNTDLMVREQLLWESKG